MNPVLIAYASLATAIISEVMASSFLQRSAQFTRLWPTIAMAVCYILSFYMLSQALRVIPLGIAYAIWGGLGIVLTALVSVFIFKQTLDAWAIVGISMIIGGVIVMNVLSRSAGH
ncbi:DMT family transporter [Erwinia sp. SLM-02]|uniref:DMT family transporter n=1 Tax=Erwinia sp. SLM-02 TaxID=3020057 RepID=UPI0028D5D662|nr:multidrug efflux SMR transporter [uncultured Erwinia sp.]